MTAPDPNARVTNYLVSSAFSGNWPYNWHVRIIDTDSGETAGIWKGFHLYSFKKAGVAHDSSLDHAEDLVAGWESS